MFKPFFVRVDKILKKVRIEEVVALETEGNYTKVFLSNKRYYLVRATLNGALEKLSSDIFIKVHRSFVVSILFIDEIYKDHVVMLEGGTVPIGRGFYKELVKRL